RHAMPYWVDEAQTAKPVTLLQAFHEPVAQHPYRLLFEPARARRRPDNDHFRPMRLLQTIAECGGDAPGGKILAFNVDVAPCGGDGVEIEGLDLPHCRTAGIGRLSTGHDHIDIRDIGLHRARPGISVDWRRRDALASPAKPALTHELRQGARG